MLFGKKKNINVQCIGCTTLYFPSRAFPTGQGSLRLPAVKRTLSRNPGYRDRDHHNSDRQTVSCGEFKTPPTNRAFRGIGNSSVGGVCGVGACNTTVPGSFVLSQGIPGSAVIPRRLLDRRHSLSGYHNPMRANRHFTASRSVCIYHCV